MKKHCDIVVIGSGLGGLVSAVIMAKEGYRVCLLEKNKQFGGNLQTFSRDKTIFDTGVHYIGGLSLGQNLNQYFHYLGIAEKLELTQLDIDGFDRIYFDDGVEYRHAQGFDHFVDSLSTQFPGERAAIQSYVDQLREVCDNFPLYELVQGKKYRLSETLFEKRAKEVIDSLTDNERLRAVLAGSNLLYAGHPDKTPFYVHALSVNAYIQSAYRCINGGSQITKLMISRLKELGGDVFKKQEVVRLVCKDKKIEAAVTDGGMEITGDTFISNVEPKQTIKLVGREHFRKPYVKRIEGLPNTIAAFSVYISLRPGMVEYQNFNQYIFRDESCVWTTLDYTTEDWPKAYMISMGIKKKTGRWADNIALMTCMRYDEVARWEDTFNTTTDARSRGEDYERFKREKADIMVAELEKRMPGIRDAIIDVYASTPLSYRDYIGNAEGAMYGYEKDVNKPFQSFISPKTKIKNLFLTGQGLNMHGILGVTISGVITCSEILGMDYLVGKIVEENKYSKLG